MTRFTPANTAACEECWVEPTAHLPIFRPTYATDVRPEHHRPTSLRLLAFTADGQYDESFGNDGAADINFGEFDVFAAYQRGGRIILADTLIIPRHVR